MIRNFIVILLLLSAAFSSATQVEKNQAEKRNGTKTKQGTIKKTYKESTNSENPKNWNNKDWSNHMKKNNLDSGLIGKSRSYFSNIKGSDAAFVGDPNAVRTDKLQNNDEFKDVNSINSFSQDLQNTVTLNASSNTTTPVSLEQTVKCYITRDIPISYTCNVTGLAYGGSINSGGLEAKRTCMGECYEQFSCIDVNPSATITTESSNEVILSNNELYITKTISIDNSKKLDYISFETEVINDEGIGFLDVTFYDLEDNDRKLYSNQIIKNNEEFKIIVNQNSKKLVLKFFTKKIEEEGKLKNIKIVYKKDSKYICPLAQDLVGKNAANFAFVCPSGKLKIFNINGNTYEICEDYGVVGDNPDGTFSEEIGCTSICKKRGDCISGRSAMSSLSLQNFREGCVEGQANCEPDTCRNLRLNGAKIINENIFDGNFDMSQTIVSNTLVPGVKRPKMLLNNDLSFDEKKREEWKDEAYENMIEKNTFAYATEQLNENTKQSDAYNISFNSSTTNGHITGLANRSLNWVLKPKAFDVYNGQYKFYAIIELIVEEMKTDVHGGKYRSKDKILYIKTSATDIFKPFARKKAFARNMVTEDEGIIEAEELTASWKYEYFNGSLQNWFSHSRNTTAENFKSAVITADDPFTKIPIIENLNTSLNMFDGVIRSRTSNGGYSTDIYTGGFNGSGQAIGRMGLYVYKTNSETITYETIVNKIENDEWEIVYSNNAKNSYPRRVKSDTAEERKDINIYLYGKENNKTGFIQMKPKGEDIGKKGFVYIFAN